MKRIAIAPRPDWAEKAEEIGFRHHTMHGEPYWDESSAYAFTLSQIEDDLEDPATELHGMCRAAVERVVASQEWMERFAIPEAHRDLVAQSWRDGAPELYGRFDMVYDGTGPAKMIEYNADTPTSLFESAAFQWDWLEQQVETSALPEGADQFNSIYEALVARFRTMFAAGSDIHFATQGGADRNYEDYSTAEFMGYAARDAGMGAHYCPVEEIGLTEEGQFADDEDRVIGTLFKLYPWEDMLRDDFARHIAGSGCRFIEPAWKSILSNKALLPLLWEMFEGHPNLLPAIFAADLDSTGNPVVDRARNALSRGSVTKPLFSREGASVTIRQGDRVLEAATDRSYDQHPMILQAYAPMPVFDGFRPVLGVWVVGETACGLGIREDRSLITQDLSRFKPHFIAG